MTKPNRMFAYILLKTTLNCSSLCKDSTSVDMTIILYIIITNLLYPIFYAIHHKMICKKYVYDNNFVRYFSNKLVNTNKLPGTHYI